MKRYYTLIAVFLFATYIGIRMSPLPLSSRFPQPIFGIASWYEAESVRDAASWYHRKGEVVEVTNLLNGKKVIVRIVSGGPDRKLMRVIDLAKEAFQELEVLEKGLVPVRIKRI